MIRFHDACGTTGKTVAARLLPDTDSVSYTHLDVYNRQVYPNLEVTAPEVSPPATMIL